MTNRIEIEELISKFLAGEASPKEAMNLEDWKTASPDNLLYFEKSLFIFDVPNIPNQNEAKIAAWQKISSSIERKQAYGKLVLLSLTVAATVLFLVLISFLINRSGRTAADPTIYTAERSEKRIRLPDATEVSLAAGSQLIVLREFDKSNRELTLIGSAFFSVQRDSLHPLIVHAKPLRIQQAGTKFRVATSKNLDTILISVFEGSAFVSDTLGSSTYVHANGRAKYVKSKKRFMVQPIPPIKANDTIIEPVPTDSNKVLPRMAIPPHK